MAVSSEAGEGGEAGGGEQGRREETTCMGWGMGGQGWERTGLAEEWVVDSAAYMFLGAGTNPQHSTGTFNIVLSG